MNDILRMNRKKLSKQRKNLPTEKLICDVDDDIDVLTNFDNITESIETLASWLDEHAEFCQEIPCDECYVYKECGHQGCDVDFCSNAKRWIKWLKQPHTNKE